MYGWGRSACWLCLRCTFGGWSPRISNCDGARLRRSASRSENVRVVAIAFAIRSCSVADPLRLQKMREEREEPTTHKVALTDVSLARPASLIWTAKLVGECQKMARPFPSPSMSWPVSVMISRAVRLMKDLSVGRLATCRPIRIPALATALQRRINRKLGFSGAHALLDGKTSRYPLGYNRSSTWIHMESSIRYLARHGRLSASYISVPCLVLLLTGKTSQRSQTRRYVKLAFTKRRDFTVW